MAWAEAFEIAGKAPSWPYTEPASQERRLAR